MSKRKKSCFVIGAIGKPKSSTRNLSNAVLSDIIKESLKIKSFDYKAERIDNKGGAGDINEAIIDMLLTAELVIVDLTKLNPNVMYEMGIRQAWDLPLIPIIQSDCLDELPFDIAGLNTVTYSPKIKNNEITFVRKKETIRLIRKQLRSILKGGRKHRVFSKAFSKIAKKSTSDIAYVALLGTLRDLDDSLYDAKRTLSRTLYVKNSKTLKNFSFYMFNLFERFSDKLHILGYFAKGRVGEPIDASLKKLLSESQKIIDLGVRIDKLLASGRSNKINKSSIDKAITSTMKLVDKIANKIETNKKQRRSV